MLLQRARAGLVGWRWGPVVLMLAGLCVASCVSIEQIAPPVDESFAIGGDAGESSGRGDLVRLAHGREVYLRHCGSCHVLPPIERYRLDQWERIMPEMVDEAKLSGDKADDVTDYVLTARRVTARRQD